MACYTPTYNTCNPCGVYNPCCPPPCSNCFTIYWGSSYTSNNLNLTSTTDIPGSSGSSNYQTNSVYSIYSSKTTSSQPTGSQIINSNYWQTSSGKYVDNSISLIQFKFNDSVNSTIYFESPHRPYSTSTWPNYSGAGKTKTKCMIMQATGKYQGYKGYVEYDSVNQTAKICFTN